MGDLVFPYEEWNPRKDVRLFRASTIRAFGVVNGALNIGDTPTNIDPQRYASVGPVLDEVMALLTECVEWLRHREISATQIQQKFNNVKKIQNELPKQRLLKDSSREINVPSDPRGFTERINKAGNTVKNF